MTKRLEDFSDRWPRVTGPGARISFYLIELATALDLVAPEPQVLRRPADLL